MATDRASHVQDLDFARRCPLRVRNGHRCSPKVRFAPEADIHRRDHLVGAHGLRRGLEIMHVGDRYGSFASRVAKYPTVFA